MSQPESPAGVPPREPPATEPRADLLAVLPLRDIVVFPHMIVPLFVGREKSVQRARRRHEGRQADPAGAQKNAGQDDPAADDIYRVGTVGTVLQLLKLPDGTVKVLVEGGRRARIASFTDDRRLSSRPIAEPMPRTRDGRGQGARGAGAHGGRASSSSTSS